MQLSETIKLYPTKYQLSLIQTTMEEYVSVVNSLISFSFVCSSHELEDESIEE